MKIVENSPQRLRLRHYGVHAGLCLFDRKRALAVVTRLALVIPYTQTRLPLSSVTDAVVTRRSHRKIYRLGQPQTRQVPYHWRRHQGGDYASGGRDSLFFEGIIRTKAKSLSRALAHRWSSRLRMLLPLPCDRFGLQMERFGLVVVNSR